MVYKTDKELSEMTPEQRDAYAKEKRDAETAAMKTEIEKSVKAAVATAIPAKTPEELETEKTEKANAVKKAAEMSEKLNQLMEQGNGGRKAKSIFDEIEKQLRAALPKLKAMKGQGAANTGKELVFEVKAASTVITTDFANDDGVTTPAAETYNNWNGEYAEDVRPDAYITNFTDNGNTDKSSLPYVDKIPTQGTMSITAEGALKPLISFSFKINHSEAVKVAGRTKISEEAIDDIPYIMSIIKNELKYEHDIDEQTNIFAKINAVASAFVAGDLASSTDAPSNYDAISASIAAIRIATKGKARPNAVLIPAADLYNMGATKDKQNNYVMPPFVLPDGTKIKGVQIVEVNDDTVAAGSFVVADFRKLKRRVYKPFSTRIGQGIQGDAVAANIVSDFESNMFTVLGESRQHFYVYKNEEVAFLKSTFAAVKTAIERDNID